MLDKINSFFTAPSRVTTSRGRLLAVLALILFSSASIASTVVAQDVRVVHAIELNRDGRYTANVMVTNMTSTAIRNWTMTFRLDTVVESIDHVGWSQFQGAFTVNGRGWTKEIAPGDVVWFTISGLSYANVVEVPRNCFFNGTACVVSGAPQPVVPAARPDQMIVSAWIDKSDATTYSGYIAILNPTDLKFPALWDLKFSTPSLLVEMQQVIWSRSGSDYQVYGHAHTDFIDAGNFVLIPIRGVHTGTPSLPSNCRLNGVACTFKTPDNLIETPWINVDIKMAEFTKSIWEGYIRIENPTNYEFDSWTLRFDLAETITEMDGMNWTRSGNTYTVKPNFGRGRILERSEYTFRIAGTWADSLSGPSKCTINGKDCLLSVELHQNLEEVVSTGGTSGGGTTGGGTTGGGTTGGGTTGGGTTGGGTTGGGTTAVTCANPGTVLPSILPTIDFRFLSVQAASYIAFIDVLNPSTSSVIKDWAMEFKLVDGMSITSITNSTWSLVGGNYKVAPITASNCIAPGATIRLNVVGTHNGNFGDPIGCNFSGNICTFLRISSTAIETEGLPEASAILHAAYPNPFNPQSSISFEVKQTQPVRVELWDALGRLRQTLYQGFATAGLLTTVQIDGSELASGMYFVRLISKGGALETQKVILQK